MTDAGTAHRRWTLATVAAVALFLGGLVLSHFVWNRLEQAPAIPCAEDDPRWQQARDNLDHAAALLSRPTPEIEITPSHLFQFQFDTLCVVRHGEDGDELRERLGVDWDCAPKWERDVLANDTFISLIAVAGNRVVPVRLNRTRFDVAGDIPARISPEARLLLRKRPGSDQILLRFP